MVFVRNFCQRVAAVRQWHLVRPGHWTFWNHKNQAIHIHKKPTQRHSTCPWQELCVSVPHSPRSFYPYLPVQLHVVCAHHFKQSHKKIWRKKELTNHNGKNKNHLKNKVRNKEGTLKNSCKIYLHYFHHHIIIIMFFLDILLVKITVIYNLHSTQKRRVEFNS